MRLRWRGCGLADGMGDAQQQRDEHVVGQQEGATEGQERGGGIKWSRCDAQRDGAGGGGWARTGLGARCTASARARRGLAKTAAFGWCGRCCCWSRCCPSTRRARSPGWTRPVDPGTLRSILERVQRDRPAPAQRADRDPSSVPPARRGNPARACVWSSAPGSCQPSAQTLTCGSVSRIACPVVRSNEMVQWFFGTK